jgi:hypothetical protein
MFGKGKREWTRRFLANQILRRDWVGKIAGVEFDFRTPELSPEKWSCPSVLSADGWDHAGWYFVDDTPNTSPTLLGVTLGDLEKRGRDQARESGKIVVGVGDRVYVKQTDWLSKATDELEPPVDQEVVSLRMVLRRESGSEESAGAVTVRRRGVLPDGSAEFGVLTALAERVELLAVSKTERAEIETLQRRVDVRVEAFEAEVRRLNPILQESGLLSAQFGTPLDVTRLANIAALFGYMLGRAEAHENLKPYARKKVAEVKRVQEIGRDAGYKNRDPKREAFAEAHKIEFPGATVASATKTYLSLNPHEDSGSVRRTMKRHFPLTKDIASPGD